MKVFILPAVSQCVHITTTIILLISSMLTAAQVLTVRKMFRAGLILTVIMQPVQAADISLLAAIFSNMEL